MTWQDVILRGQSLAGLDPLILVQAVTETIPPQTIRTAERFSGDGMRLIGSGRQYVEIAVTFAIRERRDLTVRAGVMDKVRAWAAGGGELTTTGREGRVLHVTPAQLPSAGNLRDWTASLTMTFRAYGVPYWVSAYPVEAAIRNTASGSITIGVPGNAETPLEAQIRNASTSAFDSLEIALGTQTLAFDHLGMAAGETLIISHDERGLLSLTIKAAGGAARSAMAKRTPESVDELMLQPGANELTIRSGRGCDWTIQARGRWL